MSDTWPPVVPHGTQPYQRSGKLAEFDRQHPPARVFSCFDGGSPFRCAQTITVPLIETYAVNPLAVRCTRHQGGRV